MKFTLVKDRSIELTDRDFEIFRLIQTDGAKTAVELTNHFWGGKSTKAKAGFQRIRALMQAGLLERHPQLLYLSDQTKELLSKPSSVGEVKPQ